MRFLMATVAVAALSLAIAAGVLKSWEREARAAANTVELKVASAMKRLEARRADQERRDRREKDTELHIKKLRDERKRLLESVRAGNLSNDELEASSKRLVELRRESSRLWERLTDGFPEDEQR